MSNFIVTYRNKTNGEYIVYEIPFNLFYSPFFNLIHLVKDSRLEIEYNRKTMYFYNDLRNTKAITILDHLPF